MKKVLHIVSSMNRGGLETFIMNVYRVIDREKMQFDFLVSEEQNAFSEEIRKLGGCIYFLPPRNKGLLNYRKNIRAFFSVHINEYCAVHQHVSSLSSIYPLKVAKEVGIETRIIHSHSSSIKGNKLHYVLHYFNKFRIGKIATNFYACSDLARDWLFKGTGSFSKSEIINNGIIAKDFSFNPLKRENSRKSLKIKNDTIAICHIGRFDKVKNHTFLLDIFSELVKKSEKYHLFLLGDGGLRENIELKIKTLSLTNKVTLLGVRDDVNFLMQGFDCLVFPSLYEGLPVSLVEAQASDLLVICSDTISEMSKITENIEFIPLTHSASKWATIIDDKLKTIDRKDNSNIIKEAGFDITDTAFKLQKTYLNK